MRSMFVAVIALMLTACQSLTGSTPDWWISPQADNDQWIYGAGEGYSLAQANQQALANIAGKLKTQISASLSRRTQETHVAADDYIDRQLTSSVAKVSLSHYETIKTAVVDNRTLVLVRVDRSALAKEWLRQYDSVEASFRLHLRDKKSTRFQWWLKARSLLLDAQNADQLAMFWSGLTNQTKQSHLQEELTSAIEMRKPSVRLQGSQAEINQAIRSSLLSKGLRIGGCLACDLTIRYSTKFRSDTLFGENVVTLAFSGSLTDRDGALSSVNWGVKAASMSGFAVGKMASLKMAGEKINNEGLWKAFGMETN